MNDWFMLTLVGVDRPGIVAKVTAALYKGGCHLGEASMMRLGGNFTIMMMVRYGGSETELETLLAPVVEELALHVHLDAVEAGLHRHLQPDVRISVHGADRAGIVAEVTGVLAEAGLHILDLESDVAGTEAQPIYVMHIEGHAGAGIEKLREALAPFAERGVRATLQTIETLIG